MVLGAGFVSVVVAIDFVNVVVVVVAALMRLEE